MNRWLLALVATMTMYAPGEVYGQASGIPRTPEGVPNVSGIWQALNTAEWNIEGHAAEKGVPAGQGVVVDDAIPYQAWAAEKKKGNYANRATQDSVSKCYLPGVPRITYMGFPFQIVQTPTQITILYEFVHAVRNIFMNSPHLKGPIEWWLGDSRGRWEGDTLVVDVVHFSDATWFDRAGNFHSEALHVVERYTPVDATHINYEVTIEDPKVFTRSWKMSMPLYRRMEPNVRVLEYECYTFEEESRPARK